MRGSCLKQQGEPPVPLIPVMVSPSRMTFVLEVPFGKQCSELAVGRQWSHLLSARKEEVRRNFRAGRPKQNEWIVFASGLTSRGPEDRVVVTRLMEPPGRERASRNIEPQS